MIARDPLLACALGDLTESSEAEVEEHVLSCDACAASYARTLRLVAAIGELIRDGNASLPLTRSLAEQLEADGLVSRRYVLHPGETGACSVDANDLYTLVTYYADLRRVSRVDLIREGQRFIDVPFDVAAGRVDMLYRADHLRALPTMTLELKLVAVEQRSERPLAEYTLAHTAFPGTVA
jgi:hypothetical protein